MRSTPRWRTSLSRFSRVACFILLTSAVAWAALNQGGRLSLGWNESLLIIGAGAVFYLLAVSPADRPPLLRQVLGWVVLLPPAYVGFQLLPLPLPLLKVLSPARAQLAFSLMPIGRTPAFASLSIDPATTAVFLLRTLAYSLTALLVYEISWYGWRRRSWAAVIPLIAVAALEACLGILQFADGGDVAGTYRSKDHFAGALEMVLPLAVAYAISRLKESDGEENLPISRALKACAAFAFAAAMLVGLIYSLSKMAFAAGLGGLFAMGALAVLLKLKGAGRWLAVAGLAVSITLIFVFLPTDQLANAYVQFFSNNPASFEGRAPIWNDSRQLLSSYPIFGTGLGTYATAFLKYQSANVDSEYTFAHNDYLQLTSELGALGFVIFGGVFLMAVIKAVRAACSEDWNARLLGLGCTGALTAIGIHSLADFNLYIPANALLLAWIVGVAIGIPSRSDYEKDERPSPHFSVVRSVNRLVLRGVPLLFAWLLVTYATAGVVFETKYKSDPRAESVFCHFGICDTDAVVADGAIASRGSAPIAPLAMLVEAVKSDPAAPHRWCDLGDAFLRAGRLEKARYCYSNALELGPEIPPVLVRSAKFHHAVQEDELALKLGARVLEITDAYHASILDWYRDQKFSVNDILCRGLPPGPRAVQAYLRYWMGLGDLANAGTTWGWILSHHYADVPSAREYINFLFGNGNYQEAADAWALFLGDRRNGYRETKWLFNGDFETEPSGVPLDWEIESAAGQVDTALDSNVAHTGTHSLRIRFAGTENVSYAHTSQKTSVPPGTYRFTAFIRTEDITTDKGIAFRIFDPEKSSRLDARTDQFVGTTGWRRVEQTVRVPSATKLIEIQVVREPTMKFDNKVSGTAWIDTVSLAKIE